MLRFFPIYLLLIAEYSWLSFATYNAGHVLILDSSNFTQVVQQHLFIVVEFYAPWCGHCKTLAPEYEKAAAILQSHQPPIVLAKVDANEEANKVLANGFDIRGYPTLKIFENKGAIVREFKGPRNADGIVSYLKKQVGPPSIEITSVEAAERLIEETDFLVVALLFSYGSEEFRNFTSLANELRSVYDFSHTLDASTLPSKFTTSTVPSLCIFKKFEEGFNVFKEFDVEVVKKLLDEVSTPSVVFLNKDPVQEKFISRIFANPQVSKVFLFLESENTGNDDLKAVFKQLAREYKSSGLRFLIADTKDGKNALEFFGVKNEKLPLVVIQGKDEEKYVLEKASADMLKMRFKDYIDGKLNQFHRSKRMIENINDFVQGLFRETIGDPFMSLKNGHLFVEALLVTVIVYLMSQNSYQPERRPLTKQEIDQLCDEWTPEALHPPLDKDMKHDAPILESQAGSHTVINGRDVINFSTTNYLGLMGDQKIVEACTKTLEKYGVGSCGPRGFYGTIDVHLDCEAKIARFMGTPDSILYSYGLATAASTIPAFCKRGDLILADEGVHWGIQNGLHLSRSTVKLFKHNDMSSLAYLLEGNYKEDQRRKKVLNRRFIVVEAIYQNSGKMAPLSELIHLKEKYRFRLLVDESNSIGVLGKTGRGLTEHFEVPVEKVDIITAAMGHALASVGGFCTGSAKVVDHQRLSGAGYCFSASLPPYVATASIAALEILGENPIVLSRLQNNISIFRNALSGILEFTVDSHPMSPLIFLQLRQSSGSFENDCRILQTIADEMLNKESVFVSVTKRSILDKSKMPAALRVAVSAAHTEKDLVIAAAAIQRAATSVLNTSCNGHID